MPIFFCSSVPEGLTPEEELEESRKLLQGLTEAGFKSIVLQTSDGRILKSDTQVFTPSLRPMKLRSYTTEGGRMQVWGQGLCSGGEREASIWSVKPTFQRLNTQRIVPATCPSGQDMMEVEMGDDFPTSIWAVRFGHTSASMAKSVDSKK